MREGWVTYLEVFELRGRPGHAAAHGLGVVGQDQTLARINIFVPLHEEVVPGANILRVAVLWVGNGVVGREPMRRRQEDWDSQARNAEPTTSPTPPPGHSQHTAGGH